MKGMTKKLAYFAATTKLEAIPDAAKEAAKLIILDTLGVILVASKDGACKVFAGWVKDQEAPSRSTVIGQGFQTSPLLAALANGHAAHSLDLDDSGHYSTHTLPAALAIGEPRKIPGTALLRAYILGREVAVRLDRAFDATREEGGGPTYRGWHHTGTHGSFGAAASAGVLLGLDTKQMQRAFGVAANLASGLRANMGSMAKGLFSGNAARNGVMAASLAQRNFTAEEDILEAPQGWVEATCFPEEIDWEALTRDLGNRFELEKGATTKDYPSCSPAHRPVEALLDIIRKHHVRAEQVERIECDPHLFSMRRHHPKDSQEAQYSLEYCLSVTLLDGNFGLDQMTNQRVEASDVQNLMARLSIVPPKGPPPPRRAAERLVVHLKNGQSYESEIKSARRLTGKEEFEKKYFDCALRRIPEKAANELRDTVLDLENVTDITPMMGLIRG